MSGFTAPREYTDAEALFAIGALERLVWTGPTFAGVYVSDSDLDFTGAPFDLVEVRPTLSATTAAPIIQSSAFSSEGDSSLDVRHTVETTAADMSWKSSGIVDFRTELAEKLISSLELIPGWDGYDGVVPTQEAVDNAVHFVQILPSGIEPPRPLVTGDGEVGVYWQEGVAYIEASSYGSEMIEYFARDKHRNIIASDVMSSTQSRLPRDLLTAIEKFSGLP